MTVPTFPTMPGHTVPVHRTPIWSTIKQRSLSGMETVNPLYAVPLYTWEHTFSVLRGNWQGTNYKEWQQLIDFINGLQGGFGTFYYHDPKDDTAVDEVFGTGDGITQDFQLARKLYTAGFAEPIQSPQGTIIVKDNGTPTVAFTLSAGGHVHMTAAPVAAHVLTWSGTYYWLCRFDEDKEMFSRFMDELWELKKLTFTSVKL